LKPKVLHFLWTGRIGGAERAVFNLVRSQLENSRYTPVIAFSERGGHYYDAIRDIGVEIVDLDPKGGFDLLSVPRISRLIAPYPIHHFHSAEVVSIAASDRDRGAHRLYNHRGGSMRYRGKQALRYAIVGHYIRTAIQCYTGNTSHACDFAARLTKTDRAKWNTVYNGIDFSLLDPKRSRDEVAAEIELPLDGTYTIGTSAAIRDWKRLDLLLRGCAALAPDSYRLVIIGDGPARRSLEELAGELGITATTRFLGMKKEIGDYLQLLDTFVLPSSSMESFGNSAVEAMSQGLPTIVFADGGGLVEHIIDGESGFIVKDVPELSARIDQLRNPELRHRIGETGKHRVRTRYTYESLVRAYDGLYDAMMEGKRFPVLSDLPG
jgi:glycosyltransferase involved in cell wall biosynthesis